MREGRRWEERRMGDNVWREAVGGGGGGVEESKWEEEGGKGRVT